ncbi:hypothetical protein ACFO1B_17125 [Dactylosporangium siamense]|uniref:hypothetical protein n=1 Tax=Dactylosporangium siamense TaxID=685454 RepID=UPI001941DBF1|nr:hypothetical protein [Dactylosporangium siamense]
MPIPWRSSPDAFAQILRRRGVDPAAVTDVEAAWCAFGEFLDVEVDGVDPDQDGDGFIIQWGRHSWNGGRLSLSLTRQLIVHHDPDPEDDEDGYEDDYGHDEFWQVDLTMCFDDEPDLAGLDDLEARDTGFTFDPIGPARTAALAGARADLERHPQLRAVWRATPVSSELSFDSAC